MISGMDNGHRTTSEVIIYSVLGVIALGFLALIAMLIFGGVNFDTTVSTDLNFVGTIPVDMVIYAVLGFIGWMVYIAFMDIYDSDEVKESVEDASEMADDIK
jgi:hypothetical protein